MTFFVICSIIIFVLCKNKEKGECLFILNSKIIYYTKELIKLFRIVFIAFIIITAIILIKYTPKYEVSINDEKVGTPYIIKAIGLTEKLYGALTMPGGYLSLLQDKYGLKIKVDKSDNIEVEKYTGVYKMNYATNNE